MPTIDTSLLTDLIVGRVKPQIYAFTTHTVPNYLKVGDTYRPVSTRLDEWRRHYPKLQQEFEDVATVDEDIFFRDISIHSYFSRHGIDRLHKNDIPASVYYSKEFFKGATTQNIKEAISDIKKDFADNTGTYQFYKFAESRIPTIHRYPTVETFSPRDSQADTIKRFKEAVEKYKPTVDNPLSLLMYAVMRFGKSFTSMCCATEICAKLVVVVSAKADVKAEWQKTVQSHVRFGNDYEFIDSDALKRDPHAISSYFTKGKKVVVFLTLQDLCGDDIKDRHSELFSSEIDLVIVDETHFGARAAEYGKVLTSSGLTKKQVADQIAKEDASIEDVTEGIKMLKAKIKLHLSGTPYRILMGDEFSDDKIIAFYQFSDIVDAQEKWDLDNLTNDDVKEWENPYFGFPQMIRFAFNPSEKAQKKLAEIKETGRSYAFSELFRPLSIQKHSGGLHKKFKYEEEVLELLEVIDGSKDDENLLGFLDYDKIKDGKMCRHIVCVLPYCASCDALEALIKNNASKFKNLNTYEIINISGVDSNLYPDTADVKKAIAENERQDKKTLTLTVGRMLTGSTVEQWDTMLYLKDTSSPQEYDQAIFRLQNQYVTKFKEESGDEIKFNMKPQTLLVDFAPDRMFVMQELKSQIYNANTEKNGNTKLAERIKRELQISPIVVINHNKLQEVTPANILDAVREYSSEKSVIDEANDIPADLSLFDDPTIVEIIKNLSPINSSKGLAVKPYSGSPEDDLDEEEASSDPNPAVEDGDSSDMSESKDSSEEEDQKLDKKLATYYSQILFFAFLTQNEVHSLEEIIAAIAADKDNLRMAHNVGLSLKVLKLIQKKSNPFILSKLDYKIQNINSLMRDETLPPLQRAILALNKFGRFSDSEIVTSVSLAAKIVELLPADTTDGKILDIASKQAEFAISLYSHFGEIVKSTIYSIPTSTIAYEFTRKIYSILGMPLNNVFSEFNSYDMIADGNEEIIKKLKNMNFKAIVGNPPYQDKGGSGGNNDAPIYQHFADLATNLSPDYVSLIIKAAWFSSGRENLLGAFRKRMLTSQHLEKLIVYPDSSVLFTKDVEIKGGCCYYLENKNYTGDCAYTLIQGDNVNVCSRDLSKFDVLIREPEIAAIVEQVEKNRKKLKEGTVDSIISSDTPFGISSNPKNSKKNPLSVYESSAPDHDLMLFHIENTKRKVEYISRADAKKNVADIAKDKVFITGAGGSGTDPKVMSTPIVAPKNSVCSQSFLYAAFDSAEEAQNFTKYIYTKFFRVLLAALKITQSASSRFYRFIPMQNYTNKSDIKWNNSIEDIDKQLFKKYKLSKPDIDFINHRISDL